MKRSQNSRTRGKRNYATYESHNLKTFRQKALDILRDVGFTDRGADVQSSSDCTGQWSDLN